MSSARNSPRSSVTGLRTVASRRYDFVGASVVWTTYAIRGPVHAMIASRSSSPSSTPRSRPQSRPSLAGYSSPVVVRSAKGPRPDPTTSRWSPTGGRWRSPRRGRRVRPRSRRRGPGASCWWSCRPRWSTGRWSRAGWSRALLVGGALVERVVEGGVVEDVVEGGADSSSSPHPLMNRAAATASASGIRILSAVPSGAGRIRMPC